MSQSQQNNQLEVSSKTELQYSSSNYLELLCTNIDDINKPNEVKKFITYSIVWMDSIISDNYLRK